MGQIFEKYVHSWIAMMAPFECKEIHPSSTRCYDMREELKVRKGQYTLSNWIVHSSAFVKSVLSLIGQVLQASSWIAC
jgi:hypothetical protein